MKNQLLIMTMLALGLLACRTEEPTASPLPNIVILITDDQGYGDLSCHGNPILKTPNLDQLHAESVRFTDFHVGTTCAPSRASLMTGQYCNKVGAWHTIKGREMVWPDEVLLPELLKKAGYTTGMFGKWHLGDTYPYRPQDRGFDEVLVHGGGGVGQTPDYWNNDYFDDTYFHNGFPEKKEGYCTDVWFEAALSFMEKNRDRPFFSYLSTNAPHGPFYVDTLYSKRYEGKKNVVNANFLGMIANIDENLGHMRSKLVEWGIADNTILIFLTDNGTAAGCQLDQEGQVKKGYNAGMRGKKGSEYEGGHRVPLFIHWKDGKVEGGRDIDRLAGVFDLVPTLMDWVGAENTDDVDWDGTSLRPLIEGEEQEERILFADTQRQEDLIKYRRFAVMTEAWRLVNDKLYDIQKDPGQKEDVAAAHPKVVDSLKVAYEKWWDKVSARAGDYCYFQMGKQVGELHALTEHDLLNENKGVAWNQGHIRAGKGTQGYWPVQIEAAGTYRFGLRRWPAESGLKILDAAPEGDKIPQGTAYKAGEALSFKAANISIAGQQAEALIDPDSAVVHFTLELAPGQYQLSANFLDEAKQASSCYYVYAERLD